MPQTRLFKYVSISRCTIVLYIQCVCPNFKSAPWINSAVPKFISKLGHPLIKCADLKLVQMERIDLYEQNAVIGLRCCQAKSGGLHLCLAFSATSFSFFQAKVKDTCHISRFYVQRKFTRT